ncbi:hypothetical protein GJR96_14815 [Haloferax sp. MBLA0076]|uniref:DUF7527 domain-containing protein n=1 Tax=Haloferax litoreum TaxID=2666140 RepID=A0A6A8GL86_9EURY|nr:MULTISPECIES: bZIP transcription factor [Haloferax]KAB1194644.1 hypothetical protein Hfx1148_14745 [Haloferax sp. CBA1148]MRX23222.1 hypothetical protein [Haloferax litoreum]
MDSEIIDAVTGWDSAPSGGGYGGLRSLADDGFSGAVVAGMTWGFMLNGRLLGVFEGTIADFDDESFEAYRAPDASLPLLYTMKETGGEVRAQYYTEDTPLTDADGTLSAGGFTGYVELSENVLSGDYYVVYHGGKSMSVAFVGNSKRLVTDDEAFELADDEIGIYKVYDVDIDLVEIPDDESDDAAAEDESTTGTAGTVSEAETAGSVDDEEQIEPASDSSSPETTAVDAAEASKSSGASAESSSPTRADTTGESATATTSDESVAQATAPVERAEPGDSNGTSGTSSVSSPSSAPATGAKNGSDSAQSADGETGDDVFSAEAEWRNARSIPSLDPRDSEGETAGERPGSSRRPRKRRDKNESKTASSRQGTQQPKRASGRSSSASSDAKQSAKSATAASSKAVISLKEQLSEVKAERDRLESERDAIQKERDEHQSRAEELERRVNELESEVDRLRSELDEAGLTSTDRSMSADEALRGTNLFVRYAKKSGATLEKAHAGQAKREDVVENLRLEHHTTFDTDGLGVDGQPYEEFLHEAPEYGFAKWAVTDLLYEIGETGNRSSLSGVFDSIPKADRIELYGTVSVPIGEGETEPRKFDVIFRDQMGNPLFVANLNNSRDPATQSMVTRLIKDSKAVAEANESLGSAFVVTKSFFEPDALEAATAETGGGLLSRSKRKSFVKLSRKQGYHLCLVEARSGEFHLNVPDL